MSWTSEQQAAAQAEGWALHYTIDNGASKPYLRVYGLRSSNHEAARFVHNNASRGSKLHIEALRAILQSQATRKK
jgi:hypothetical protein